MIKHFSQLTAVKSKVSVTKVSETCDCEKQDQIGIVKLALVLKRVVSQLISVGFIMNVWLIIPVVSTSIAAEKVNVAKTVIIKMYLLS